MFLHFLPTILYNEVGGIGMKWYVWIAVIIVILISAEALLIIPDRMPWNRRKRK